MNDRADAVTATITLTRSTDETTLLSKTIEFNAEEERQWQFQLENTSHELRIAIQGGTHQSFSWTPGGEYCCARAAITATQISISGIAY